MTREFKLGLRHGIVKNEKAWSFVSPGDFANNVEVDEARAAVIASSLTDAAMVQGAHPRPDTVLKSWLKWTVELQSGESKAITFCLSIGETKAEALASFDALVDDFQNVHAQTTEEWNAEMRAAFTEGNDRFAGHLPVLKTDNEDLLRLYHMALGTVLFSRRKTRHSVYGTTYITVGPRFWQTASFLWDTSLTSVLLAQLEPDVLQNLIETWIGMDIHKHLATDFLTGDALGAWYSVNDFAMCRMAFEYLRWTGDHAWLDKVVGDRTVYDHLMGYATHWRELDTHGHGLADYGGIWNLLEAVGTYVHEVASLNAAVVWCLRFVSDLARHRGDASTADALALEASGVLERVKDLFIAERGCFNIQKPDGSRQEVGHCYDFGTVLWTVGADLDTDTLDAMTRFFIDELQTPAWMRSLSIKDIDTTYSIRPDHQWTGAYTAWPAIALSGLFTAGQGNHALKWMSGLAESMRQGPVAQAHLAETAFPPENGGGALKAPSDSPFVNDWCDVSGGTFYEPILTGLFGVRAPVFGELRADCAANLTPCSRLEGLNFQGTRYNVDSDGATISPGA